MQLPNLLATRPGRLAAFFSLYVTEGIPVGFTATAVATQMRRQGVGPAQIGVFVGALYLPWAWKWLIGPFVDVIYSDRLGRRRAWIVAAQVLMSLSLLAAMPVDFSLHIGLFTAIVLVINVFGATQDVAIDALACGVLEDDERGLANGLMFAGAYLGQAVGGAGVLFLSERVGFRPTFVFVAGSILMVTVFVALGMQEPPTHGSRARVPGGLAAVAGQIRRYAGEAVRAFFGTRAAMAGLAFAVLPAGAYGLSLALQSNLAVELGLTDRQVGLLALFSTVISAAGCIAGGWLSDRFGRRKMLALFIVTTAVPTVALAVIMQHHGWIMPVDPQAPDRPHPPLPVMQAFWAASMWFALFQGLMYGTRTALFMDISTPEVAATQFTAYMACMNLVTWYSASWQGYCIEAWGYPTTLALDAAAGLACVALLPLMGRTR
ncbi:MAG TPA: MFS transporter [Planctomycetaceae bacterium]|nr:MFS transporter [Planctomycetaceae bacterium]